MDKCWWHVWIGGHYDDEMGCDIFFGNVREAAEYFAGWFEIYSTHEYGTTEYWLDQVQHCEIECLKPDGQSDEFENTGAHPWDFVAPDSGNLAEQMVYAIGTERKQKEV